MGNHFLVTTAIPDPGLQLLSDAGQVTVLPEPPDRSSCPAGTSQAGLDVFEDEPRLSPGLAELPNTVLLPHVGSATVPVRAQMARLSALNAIAIAEDRLPPHPVNPLARA